jgi:hypothetical protein
MKLKNNLAVFLIMIMSAIMLIGSAAQATDFDALCFLPTDDITELNEGDKVVLKANHNDGAVWLGWQMNIYNPEFTLSTTEPQDAYAYNRFSFHQFNDPANPGVTGFYIISPYDGMKYYISQNGLDLSLETLYDRETKAYFFSDISSYDMARFIAADPTPMTPISFYLYASPTITIPDLAPGIAARTGGINWSVLLGHHCNVNYTVTADWGTGYNATITIENNTGHPITDWALDFRFSHDIDSVSSAVIESRDGVHYKIKNAGWNSTIAPASSVTFYISGNTGLQYEPWAFTVVNN